MGSILEGAGKATAGRGLAAGHLKAMGARQISFARLHPDAIIPVRAHPTDAGLDLSAYIDEDIHLPGSNFVKIPTGVAVAIPEGYVGLICPRSGLAAKHGITITNAPGIIDSGYRGELIVVLQNTNNKIFTIHKGDRIAQLVITPALHVDVVEVPEFSSTDRGEDGFGSTGK